MSEIRNSKSCARIVAAVRRYNRWRRGDEKLQTPCPTRTGKDLDALCDLAEAQDAAIARMEAASPLLAVLGGAQSARLTAEKTETVRRRDGYEITGFVLCAPDGRRCIVEMSAVRWLSKQEMWWLMQESQSPIHHES